MLETLCIEYRERVIREINKSELTKVEKIKRQNGAFNSNSSNKSEKHIEPSRNTGNPPTLTGRKSHKSDIEGYYHRKISRVGNFKLNKLMYYFDPNRAGQEILIQIAENVLRIYDLKKVLLGTLDKRIGKKYS